MNVNENLYYIYASTICLIGASTAAILGAVIDNFYFAMLEMVISLVLATAFYYFSRKVSKP